MKSRSAAQIVRDAIDAYDPDAEITQSQEQELLAIAHAKVREAIIRTEETIKKVDTCLENLSEVKGIK
jgi:prophage DNA circulation protein